MKTYLLCLEIKVPEPVEMEHGPTKLPHMWEHKHSGPGTAWESWRTVEALAQWVNNNANGMTIRAVHSEKVEQENG